MEATYWIELVENLSDESKGNYSVHVLSSLLPDDSDNNLNEARKYIEDQVIISQTIKAYKNWNNQPYCDIVLSHFGESSIPALVQGINNDENNVRRGLLSLLYELDKVVAYQKASELMKTEHNKEVLDVITWILDDYVEG